MNDPETAFMVVPEGADDAPFTDSWRRIVEIPELFIPCALNDTGDARPPEGAALLDLIDTVRIEVADGMNAGAVYSDRRMVGPRIVIAAMPTAALLERFFHNETLNGLMFNPPGEGIITTAPGRMLLRFAIPRVAGMAASTDPFAAQAPHAALAKNADAADHIYTAFYHAAAAREAGEALDDHFFIEVTALMTLGLMQQAQEYIEWYLRQGGTDPRIELVKAQMLTLNGQGAQVLDGRLKTLLNSRQLAAWAWREQGRALFFTGRTAAAVTAFEESLYHDANSLRSMMGLGIALRGLNWEPQNDNGLRQALKHFERIIAGGDFLLPEALHHAGTIQLALGDFAALEALMRRTLALRNSPVSRRNLCLALHAQGKIEEAREVYRFLVEHFPAEGERLHHYFQ